MFYEDVIDERAGLDTSNQSVTVVLVTDNSSGIPRSYNKTIIPRSMMNYLDYTAKTEVEWLWSITVAIFVLFGMFGAFASGKWADYFGRQVMYHFSITTLGFYIRHVHHASADPEFFFFGGGIDVLSSIGPIFSSCDRATDSLLNS